MTKPARAIGPARTNAGKRKWSKPMVRDLGRVDHLGRLSAEQRFAIETLNERSSA
jgi:hypothetical protein